MFWANDNLFCGIALRHMNYVGASPLRDDNAYSAMETPVRHAFMYAWVDFDNDFLSSLITVQNLC